jgi:hypothetical protein
MVTAVPAGSVRMCLAISGCDIAFAGWVSAVV